MYRRLYHKAVLCCALLFLSCRASQGREWLAGLYQSVKGLGATLSWNAGGDEMDFLTLRSDFYGLLSGRTGRAGFCVAYTHDYAFYERAGAGFRLRLHAGAGGTGGFVHDFEKGFFSAFDRDLKRDPGWMVALAGNVGLRLDVRRLTLDLGFSLAPGLHLRSNPDTGTLTVSLYKNGLYHVWLPQINLLYRF